jgi:lysophospholipase L1-like esterase
MLRTHSMTRRKLLLALVAVASVVPIVAYGQAARLHPHRIAVFGSSVANGTGDELARDGYTGLLRAMMAGKGWEVLNQSRGGDNTRSIVPRVSPEGAVDPRVRYLMTVNPTYVVIGLSFGNEGLYEATEATGKEAVYDGYLKGIRALVDRARQNNIVPIVALAYPRQAHTAEDTRYVRRANVVQSTWDVPTVNFLGAVDDGAGRWALGFDDKHPQASGHREMFYAFVPTLFEALEQGKPAPIRPAGAHGFARIMAGVAPLTFEAPDTMHPFSIGVTVRASDEGTVATIRGMTLAARSELIQGPARSFQATTLYPDRAFTSALGIQNGKWIYRSASGAIVDSGVRADGQWHDVVLSHFTARGETLLYIDGKLGGRIAERLEPRRFVIGGPGGAGAPAAPRQADYRDALIYRAGLNDDEAAALHQGELLHASLEIYSPLDEGDFTAGSIIPNRAQSLTALKVGSDRVMRGTD